jgi:hypothetical protein
MSKEKSPPVPEIEISRLVLRDPMSGSIRAVLETSDPNVREEGIEDRVVRLKLRTAAGVPVLTVEVDETCEPRLFIGERDTGPTVAVRRGGVDVWRDGSIAAAIPEE